MDFDVGQAGPEPFQTVTKSAFVWLNTNNVRYSVEAYQRGYEWNEVQAERLLNSILKVVELSEIGSQERSAFLKLGEVVLLLKGRESHMQGNIWEGHKLDVEIVDGQQRLTTLLLLHAVLQYLFCRGTMKLRAEGVGCFMVDKTIEIGEVEKAIETRFTFRFLDDTKLLVTSEKKEHGLAEFTFRNLQRLDYLMKLDKADGYSREKSIAVFICNWLTQKNPHLQCLLKSHKPSSTSTTQLKLALHSLYKFYKGMNYRVLWTTSLTQHRQLALHTFLALNCETMRVALATPDVIKVALVSDLRERQAGPALDEWESIEKMLSDAASTLSTEDTLQWLQPTFGASAPLTGSRLMLDFLHHVCELDPKRRHKPSTTTSEQALVHFYAEKRKMDGDEDQWDPATYITVELQPYARAYATMLTRCLHRTLNRKENKKLNHPTMLALVNLLSMPDQLWRLSALQIIHKCEGSLEELENALTSLEYLTLNRMVNKFQNGMRTALQTDTHYINMLDKIGGVDEFTQDIASSKTRAGLELLKTLYFADVYGNYPGAARSLLLQLEHSMVPVLRKDSRDKTVFGGMHKPLLHKMGNLALLNRKDNSELSNLDFKDKKAKIIELNTNKCTRLLEDIGDSWDVDALLKRHEKLIRRLAKRHGIEANVPSDQWIKWRGELDSRARQSTHAARVFPAAPEPPTDPPTQAPTQTPVQAPQSLGDAAQEGLKPPNSGHECERLVSDTSERHGVEAEQLNSTVAVPLETNLAMQLQEDAGSALKDPPPEELNVLNIKLIAKTDSKDVTGSKNKNALTASKLKRIRIAEKELKTTLKWQQQANSKSPPSIQNEQGEVVLKLGIYSNYTYCVLAKELNTLLERSHAEVGDCLRLRHIDSCPNGQTIHVKVELWPPRGAHHEASSQSLLLQDTERDEEHRQQMQEMDVDVDEEPAAGHSAPPAIPTAAGDAQNMDDAMQPAGSHSTEQQHNKKRKVPAASLDAQQIGDTADATARASGPGALGTRMPVPQLFSQLLQQHPTGTATSSEALHQLLRQNPELRNTVPQFNHNWFARLAPPGP